MITFAATRENLIPKVNGRLSDLANDIIPLGHYLQYRLMRGCDFPRLTTLYIYDNNNLAGVKCVTADDTA